ncbi:MAG: carbonic anhydrase, partial [Lachnospiraceae bacterium]|nr:carbonic anhydrase [Lachnospiraceae bacterium]
AIVLACSDSRTPPEIFFDQKLGDLFTIRNAGNIADDSAIGSIEFAVSVLKVPLITVVGHNECGAVLAAYQNIGASGKLKVVLDSIKPALEGSKDENEAINANIINTVNKIKENNVVKEHHTAVLGAHYNIKTGVVNWVV